MKKKINLLLLLTILIISVFLKVSYSKELNTFENVTKEDCLSVDFSNDKLKELYNNKLDEIFVGVKSIKVKGYQNNFTFCVYNKSKLINMMRIDNLPLDINTNIEFTINELINLQKLDNEDKNRNYYSNLSKKLEKEMDISHLNTIYKENKKINNETIKIIEKSKINTNQKSNFFKNIICLIILLFIIFLSFNIITKSKKIKEKNNKKFIKNIYEINKKELISIIFLILLCLII